MSTTPNVVLVAWQCVRCGVTNHVEGASGAIRDVWTPGRWDVSVKGDCCGRCGHRHGEPLPRSF